ncbi:MAG: kelch repeat-containing protein, partial [Planctomycetota bacterium]
LQLTWTLSTSATTLGYTVEVSTDGGMTWPNSWDAGNQDWFDITSSEMTIQYGTLYELRVRAYDGPPPTGNTSSWLIVNNFLTPPAPPLSPVGIPGSNQVRLFWGASPSATTMGYRVYISADAGQSWDAGTDVGNVLDYLFTQDAAANPLQNGVSYLFRIRAYDATGQESIPIDAAQTTVSPSNVPPPPPNPVQNLTATAGNQQIQVDWLPPAVGSGGPVGQYEVSWNDTGSTTVFPNTIYVPNTTLTYTIMGLTNGVQYTIRVRAVGSSTSIVSSPEFATATPGAPNIKVVYSEPGGPYRYRPAVDSTLPSLGLTGTQNETNPGGGVIYYTVDGTNPVISAAARQPVAAGLGAGVTDGGGSFNGTFVQANTGAGVGTALNLDYFGNAGNEFVQVKAFFDPDGTVGQTSGNGNEGITMSVAYFIFNSPPNDYIPFGGTVQRRVFHTGSLLPNGDVLLTGGTDLSGNVHQDSEVFNKNIEFFFSRSLQTTPRAGHVAVTLDDANNRVLLAGGRRAYSFPPDLQNDYAQDLGAEFAVESYDPTSGLFTGILGGATRIHHKAVLLSERVSSNRVLIAGGISNTTQTIVGAFASSGSTPNVVHTFSFAAAAVSIGDFVVFTSAPVNGEIQIITGVGTNSTSGATVLTLGNPLTADPSGATFNVFSPNYNTCEIYDPVAGTIAAGGLLPERRFGHAMTLLQDGRVLLTGGYYPPIESGATDVEWTNLVFDPTVGGAAGTWSRAGGNVGNHTSNPARLQDNRYFHTSTLLQDGKVLIAGGISNGTGIFTGVYSQGMIHAHCDLCESAGRSASEFLVYPTSGNMKTRRFFHTATRLKDGRVLLTGGYDFLTAYKVPDGTATAELYDPHTGTFRYTAGNMLEPRAGHQATLLSDGRVLITGGRPDFFPEIYDPATDKFTATAGTMTGHHYLHPASVKLNDGRVLNTGGQRPNHLSRTFGSLVGGPVLDMGEILDPKTSLFTPLTTFMTDPRMKHTMTLLDDGTVFIAAGETEDSPTVPSSTSDLFDPLTDTLTTGPNISARYGHSAVKLNPFRTWTTGTATFNGTTTVTGTGTAWTTAVQPGDRINLGTDSSGAYFEITAVVSDTQLTIRAGGGFGFPIPAGTGAYTIRIERPYITGTATFTYGSAVVTGTGTAWDQFLVPGMVIRPATTLDFYVIITVDSATQVTLTTTFRDRSSPAAEAYIAQGNSRVLLLGGGRHGQPLVTGEVFDPSTNSVAGLVNTMSLGRFQHTATLLPNGWVFILGGNNNFDRTAELFDPATRRFKFITVAMAFAPRNNHSARLMPGSNVFIAGGEVAQGVTEVFFPDSDSNPNTDADGDGIGGIDLTVNSFQQITSGAMNGGRVAHTMTYLPGATDQILFTGGTATPGRTTGELFTWNTLNPTTASTFGGGITLARSPIQAHAAVLMDVNDNVVVMRGHTVQVFLSR